MKHTGHVIFSAQPIIGMSDQMQNCFMEILAPLYCFFNVVHVASVDITVL